MKPGAHLSLVAGAALAIGLAEATFSVVYGVRGAYQYVPWRLWFVAPLVWVAVGIVFGGIAIPLFRRRGSLSAVMAMIALFVIGHAVDQSWKRIAVAIAITVVLCAIAALIARWWLRKSRHVAAWIAAALIAALVIPSVSEEPGGDGRRDPARPGPSLTLGMTGDVVVIFLDTVPYTSLADANAPVLSQFARESVVFDRAYATAPWTLPSHFSAVTGLPAHRLGVTLDDQRYQLSDLTLAELFRRRGYRTAAVISNTFLNRGTGFQRGFDSFEQAGRALDVCRTAPGLLADHHWPWFAATVCNWSASEVTERALRQIDGNAHPLFLLVNYMDAHDPYYVERDCRPPGFEQPWPRNVPPSQFRARHYEAHLNAIRCIDRRLGQLLERLKPNTIVAILSDHGEHFGDHDLVRHGNSLYTQLLHVPLMIRMPGQPPRHVSDPASLAILPALLEGTQRASVSVLSYLDARSTTQWSLIRGRFHLIFRDGREELYDLERDPQELHPIAAAPPVKEMREELRRQRPLVDDEQRGTFRSLGYVH